jgi:hypothetical protein
MGWKSVWKGTNINEALLLPEKNRGWTGKKICKSVEQEENHEKDPRRSWERNQIGNHSGLLEGRAGRTQSGREQMTNFSNYRSPQLLYQQN